MRRASIREEFCRPSPARAAQGKKTFEEAPGIGIVDRVVREPAHGLVVEDTSHCQTHRFLVSDEAFVVAPGNDALSRRNTVPEL